ncbi:hypothetical protein JL720_16335 [Aureococcus anophagefferens]|nr:hypothetical protein JL720_16335 [Aureococcus anophagefferens]
MADVPIDLTDNTDEIVNLTSPRKSLAQEEDERLSAAAAILLASVPPDTLKPGKARRLCRKQLGDPSLTPRPSPRARATALTEAKVRTCPACGAKFFKSDGCNKMTCACGAWSCYVCRAPIPKDVGYKHFARRRTATTVRKCRLYTDDAEDERAALAEAAAKAREESGADASVVEGLLDQASGATRGAAAGPVIDFRAALDQARRRRAIPGGASTRSTRSAAARGSATCSAAAERSAAATGAAGRRRSCAPDAAAARPAPRRAAATTGAATTGGPGTTGAGRSRGARRRLRPGPRDDADDFGPRRRRPIDLTDEPPTFRRADRRPYAPPRDPWN